MNNQFFAMLSRMKYINRWGLMRNTIEENIAEHSLETAMIAHALAVINNIYFNGTANPERIALYAMYHDVPEIITGDLPTPVKYFDPAIKKSYDEVEKVAIERLLSAMPSEMSEVYRNIIDEKLLDEQDRTLVKAADKISALIKCIEEHKMGNQDFIKAEESTRKAVLNLNCREADYFLEHFIGAYGLTLDEQA